MIKEVDCELEGEILQCLSYYLSFSLSEKHKAEMRDRNVLEILQFKDQMIEDLEQVRSCLSSIVQMILISSATVE